MPVRLDVATTFVNDSTYNDLFALYARALAAMKTKKEFVLDFSGCTFLHQNAVSFLGGLTRLLQRNGCKVYINRASLLTAVKRNLERNGFLRTLGLTDAKFATGNTIPFREDRQQREGHILRYLREDWLGRGWVNVSDAVKDSIVTAVWEIYTNAFEHGESGVGVFSCGQLYPKRHEIALTVVDFGVGIPGSVRSVKGLQNMSAQEAIEWALLRGNTSKQGNRGVGLDILREFIRVNRGKLEILSHDAHIKIAAGRQISLSRNHSFGGTLINIVLKQDEKRYVFAEELTAEELL